MARKDIEELTKSMFNLELGRYVYPVCEILATPQYHIPDLAKNETYDVLVQEVGERSCFVSMIRYDRERQLFLDQMEVALTFLDRYFTSWSRQRAEVTPQIHSTYAAFCEDKWFRVRVMRVDTSQHTAEVYSLDFGWEATVEYSQFRNLPLDFLTQKPLCTEVFLHSNRRLSVGNRATIKLVSETLPGKWKVDLLNQKVSKCTSRPGNEKEIGPATGNKFDHVTGSNITDRQNSEKTANNNHQSMKSFREKIKATNNERLARTPQTNLGRRKPKGPNLTDNREVHHDGGPELSRPLESKQIKQVRFGDTILPPNQVTTVIVVHCGIEGTFVIREADIDNFSLIQKALEPLEKTSLPITFPRLQKLCLAPYCDAIYRARIIDVEPSLFKCRVVYIDYGNEAELDFDDLRELPNGLTEDNFTFKIHFEGQPVEPETVLKVIPKSTRRDGTLEVEVVNDASS